MAQIITVYLGGGIGPISIPLPQGLTTPAYGTMVIVGNAAAQLLAGAGVNVPITTNWTTTQGKPSAGGVTVQPAAGTITIGVAGVYQVGAGLNLSSPSNAGDKFRI